MWALSIAVACLSVFVIPVPMLRLSTLPFTFIVFMLGSSTLSFLSASTSVVFMSMLRFNPPSTSTSNVFILMFKSSTLLSASAVPLSLLRSFVFPFLFNISVLVL